MPISPTLLSILACPDCHGDIKYYKKTTKQPEYLKCLNCQRKFQIKNNIPIMLPKEETI